jgi:L-iditol 2-dehydrogenase
MHAVNRASPSPSSTALVIGAGTVGLLTAAMALQAGCTSVLITDVDAGRVRYATENSFATHGHVVPTPHNYPYSFSGTSTPISSGIMTPMSTYSSTSSSLDSAKSLASELLSVIKSSVPTEEDEHEGVDLTFECTGKETCMQTALYATNPGGKVIMVGMGTPIQTLPLSTAHLREIDILGIFRYCNTYKDGIKLLSSGVLPALDRMVTHRFKGLGAAKEAFELAGRTCDDAGHLVLKVVVEA